MNKFRIWDSCNKAWLEDNNYGFYFRCRKGGGLGHVRLCSDGRQEIDYLPQSYFIVQDATGLQDMNGRDIYVGDYVSVIEPEHVFEVRQGKVTRTVKVAPPYGVLADVEINCFYFHHLKSGNPCFSLVHNKFGEHDLARTKVIGNIYDNPKGINK